MRIGFSFVGSRFAWKWADRIDLKAPLLHCDPTSESFLFEQTEYEPHGNGALVSYQFHDANTIPWRKSTFANGIEVKDLGTSDGRSMQLVRFAPGASFPLHNHLGPEFIYLLEGTAIQEGKSLSAGWSAVADTGTTDSNFHSPTGCVFLTVYTD